jgi:hypothetical protein
LGLPVGAIIATAELVGCHKIEGRFGDGRPTIYKMPEEEPGNMYSVPTSDVEILFGDWMHGRYAWEFANMKMLDAPIPAKGRQRLWDWPGK